MKLFVPILTLLILISPGTIRLGAQEREPGPLTIVAHRGLAPGVPENTMAAFRKALSLGVDLIEIDIRFTKDGQAVIMHDRSVNRTTNGNGYVRNLTLSQVKRLDAGSWFSENFSGERVPSFEEVLALVSGSRTGLLLDIKESRAMDTGMIIRLVKKA